MFTHPDSEIFIPDGTEIYPGLARTTHLAISAHQDDLEIMAVDGILHCFEDPSSHFSGVVMTNGKSSPRSGLYADMSDSEMMQTRYLEQKKAAYVGNYASIILLGHSSSALKNMPEQGPVEDLKKILSLTKPSVVYTHNLADKHPTHIAVTIRVIASIRGLAPEDRPEKLYGCEVWRNLDWLPDSEKVVFDCTARTNLQEALLGVFDSQITGGKRYDLATMGRRLANATFFESHGTDQATHLAYGMDLTPLIAHDDFDIVGFIDDQINHFRQEVTRLLKSVME